MNRAVLVRSTSILLSTLLVSTAATAQSNFPNRAIKIIVGTAAGTGSDSVTRYFCTQLADVLGQPCTVDNRPGANNLVAISTIKNAPADGYTLILGSNSPMAVNPAIIKDLPYDPVKDFKPIHAMTIHPNALIVSGTSPIRSVADLVAAAKKDNRMLNAGVYASLYELATGWLSTVSGAKFVQVPYKGLGPTTVDLIGGQIDFAFVDLAGVAPLLRQGKLRMIGIMNDKSHADFPDVPPVRATFPEMVNFSWTALFMRSEVPEDATRKLSEAMARIITTDGAKEFAKRLNLELLPMGPTQLREFQITEIARFKRIAAAANIQLK